MRFNVKGDWKFLLLLGGIVLLVFILAGALLSSIFSLFVWVLQGIGTFLGSLVGFAFQSIYNLLIVALIIFLAYRGYLYLTDKEEEEVNPDSLEYSEEDFERGDEKNE